MRWLDDLEGARALIDVFPITVLYFSGADCGVCHVLRPKLEEMLEQRFPRVATGWIDLDRLAVASGEYRVFTIPTLICFFDGREGPRFSRGFAVGEVAAALERPYEICFGDNIQ